MKNNTMSPAGRANIVAAQKARWAKVHAAKEAVATPPKKVGWVKGRKLSKAHVAAIKAGKIRAAEKRATGVPVASTNPTFTASAVAVTNRNGLPSIAALNRAIVIAEEIVSLQDQLRALLAGRA